MNDVLHVEIEGPVATVWLNRPEVRNALNALLIGGLREAMTSLDANPDVAAIVLTGADPAFCAGLDLHDLAEGTLGGGGCAADPGRDGHAGRRCGQRRCGHRWTRTRAGVRPSDRVRTGGVRRHPRPCRDLAGVGIVG